MKNQIHFGIILSYIQCIIGVILGLVYVPILVYYLSANEYGIYQLMSSFLSFVLILDFGMMGTITRYYSKYNNQNNNKEKENILAISFVIYIIITIILVIIGGLIYKNLNLIYKNTLSLNEINLAKKILIIIIINAVIVILSNLFTAVIQANERFIFAKSLLIIKTCLLPILTVIALIIKPGSLSVFITQMILSFIISITSIIYCVRALHIRIYLHNIDKSVVLELCLYSFFLFLNIIVDELFWKTDVLILGAVREPFIVAVYGTASIIITQFRSFASIIHGIFLPKLTNIITTEKNMIKINIIFIKICRIQFYVVMMIFSAFIIFGKEFVQLWVGSDYNDVYIITVISMIALIIPLIQSIGISILRAMNKQGFRSILYLITAVLNVAFTIPAAKLWGGIGCVIVTSLFLIINTIVMNVYYCKVIHLDIKLFWQMFFKLLISLLVSISLGIIINNVKHGNLYISLSIKIFIYLITYFIIIWLTAFNSDEKKYFILIKNKIVKDKKNE